MLRRASSVGAILLFACSPGSVAPPPVDAGADPYPPRETLAPTCPYAVKIGGGAAVPGLPPSGSSRPQKLFAMRGLANGEAWAIAGSSLASGVYTAALAHYVKGSWNKEIVDELVANEAATIAYFAAVFDLSMLPTGEGWILMSRVGKDSRYANPVQETLELVHRDAGGAWSVIPFPEYKRRSLFDNPLSIQAFSPFDIYVCGGSTADTPRLLHYSTDLTWAEEPLPITTSTQLFFEHSCVIAGGQPNKLAIAFSVSVAVGAEASWVGSSIPTFEPLREGHVEAVMRSDDTPGALLVRESFGPTTKVNASYVDGAWTTFRLPEMDLAKFARTADGHLYAAGSADGAAESPTRLFARGADGKWGDCGTLPGTADQVVGGGVGMFWVGGTKPDGTAYLLDVRETP